ncbi:hypothetical protein GCM10008955_29820 [Deinococcus malanensis]|uniref:GAF domain-containing protein n=1 Tax=Deinococcus malanensis TaxID=1706855 RepID=A0ABQ2EYT5_9DEIO|nr:GAF domain-containing protein [Deinococcus malanensis]GGK33806.1 hypothetical protein GCM10008955_29820 [Deinococcus malanensis]
MPVGETFCQYTLESDSILVIPDTTQDARSALHRFVTGEPGLRFYAGAPIITGGFRIGTVCVLDTRPHDADEFDLGVLTHMALMVAATLEARKLNPRAKVVYPRYRAQTKRSEPN